MSETPAGERPFIFVLAGVNGAGKSSVGGALLAEHGLDWFDPDSFARELASSLGIDQQRANGLAWEHGRKQLEDALRERRNHAFETTLGGNTIALMLAQAAQTHDVIMLFCGLSSPEQHLRRVRLRVARGGHDIPEPKIRERWVNSRVNLISLMPYLTHLQVFDNSTDVAPGEAIPDPLLVLEMAGGQLLSPDPKDAQALQAIPVWARPLVQAAIERLSG
ncbi:AAA family ATPase [Pseudomonas asplenii]|uniref:AAA family ATPase n=1 Tax=Pseudomonas asplenii TaxID=53407 RepID=UPI00036E357E|nr:AAA family ATPase [Pseudomonas fuscovaginae]